MIPKTICIDAELEEIYNCIPNKSQEMRQVLENYQEYVETNRELVLSDQYSQMKTLAGVAFSEDLIYVTIDGEKQYLLDHGLKGYLFSTEIEDIILAKILILERGGSSIS